MAPEINANSPVALITGSSSGIGLLTAVRFAQQGYRVYASLRDPKRSDGLLAKAKAAGVTVSILTLDVCSDKSVQDAVRVLLDETEGRIDVLVNNAGYKLSGPIETLSPDELRDELETNLLGVLRVTRAVLPAMRARRTGSIVNVSSVSGRVVLPVSGPYHISKWSLEAMIEALRYEVAAFGIRVTLIEPGPFDTPIRAHEKQTYESLDAHSPYRRLVDGYLATSEKMHRGDPRKVVDIIWKAATHPQPRLRWPVGFFGWLGCLLRPHLPDGIYEWYVRRTFGKGSR